MSQPSAGRPGHYAVRADQVATATGMLTPGWVRVADGRIEAVGHGSPPVDVQIVEIGSHCVAAGFVDVHVHGGAGVEVNGDRPDDVADAARRVARFHAMHGTTSLVATTVSDTHARLEATLAGIAIVASENASDRAEVIGSHLEGPWLSPARAGAQDPGSLRPPDTTELLSLLRASAGTLRMVTIAPELVGASELIRAVLAADVAVAIGHTDATFEQARAAIDAGTTHATHLFNAMTPLHHRHPGPIAAALLDGRVSLEVIADGVHLHPAVLELVAAVAPDRLVLVSDAICAAGWPEGTYRLGGLDIEVQTGRVSLAGDPATLAGSVLTMDQAVANLVRLAGVPLHAALRAASLTPADAVGASTKGRLAPGADADFVVLDDDLALVATVVRGRPVHDPAALLSPVVAAATEAGA